MTSEPTTAAGRALVEECGECVTIDDILAIEVEASQQDTSALRTVRATLAGLSLPLGTTREAAQHERDTALAIIDEALATERATAAVDVRLAFRDELAEAEHEVAARLHVYLWGKTEHQTEPDDGSDCQTCYDEVNGLFYGTIVPAVDAAARLSGESE